MTIPVSTEEMINDYASHMKNIDLLNGGNVYGDLYYLERAKNLWNLAGQIPTVDPDLVLAIVTESARIDLSRHPNQEGLEELLEQLRR